MSHIKNTHKVPMPPKPFWKMTIPELNKYSQQMIIYDKMRQDIKSNIRQTQIQKSNITHNIIYKPQLDIHKPQPDIHKPQPDITRKRHFNKTNNQTKKRIKNRRKTSKSNHRKKNIRKTKKM
jgi:hypothetical protein